jgi:C4-dicarboxylate-specific signal transduction histidine kinase
MNNLSNNLLNEDKLAFFGTITASISHELNNVLSIINEYSGLLEDLVLASKKGRPLDENRIQKIVQNIAKQIKRERDIIKLLNNFAHRVDTPITKFSLNELVNDITRLTQRFASLKKVSLEITLPKDDIFLTNNPFTVQHIMFSCLNLALESSEPDDDISIALDKEESQAIINITSPPIDENSLTDEKIQFMTILSTHADFELNKLKPNNNQSLFRLFIPLSTPDVVSEHSEDS